MFICQGEYAMKAPITPPTYVFSYAERVLFGLREDVARKILRPKKHHFIKYEDGEAECLRCGSNQAFEEHFIFDTFAFLWSEEHLVWKPYYGWKKCFVPSMVCPDCDKPFRLRFHVIISFERSLPEKLLLPGSPQKHLPKWRKV